MWLQKQARQAKPRQQQKGILRASSCCSSLTRILLSNLLFFSSIPIPTWPCRKVQTGLRRAPHTRFLLSLSLSLSFSLCVWQGRVAVSKKLPGEGSNPDILVSRSSASPLRYARRWIFLDGQSCRYFCHFVPKNGLFFIHKIVISLRRPILACFGCFEI